MSGNYVIPTEIQLKVLNTIETAYHKLDGDSHLRVAHVIMDSLKNSDIKLKRNQCMNIAYGYFVPKVNAWSAITSELRKIMKISVHWSFSKLRNTARKQLDWDSSDKVWKLSDVQKIISNITKAHSEIEKKKIVVRKAMKNKDYFAGFEEGRSVVIMQP
jgi:hypothetical protein